LLCFCLFAVAACDDKQAPRAQHQKKLALPQGESPLDDLLKKPPPAPPVPAHLDAEPTSYSFTLQPAGSLTQGRIRLVNSGAWPVRPLISL